MALFKIDNEALVPISRTTFAEQNLTERANLQKMLRARIDAISPDTLIVAEEFGDWEDSRRRIDLLGVDKDANLVVIELKRTEDGGYMELQALRYAAMISTLTFDKLVSIYEKYLRDNNQDIDAADSLMEFLGWAEPDEDDFAQETKIILVSAEFSKELISSVMWLNDFNLGIRCVRMHPYQNNGEVLLDIQTVVPLPEAADYQIKIREKKQKEREARTSSRDTTKFDVSIAEQNFSSLSKRWTMFHLISNVLANGGSPSIVARILPSIKFQCFEGALSPEQVYEKIMEEDRGGEKPRSSRFFINAGEFFHIDGKTYVLSNQWGGRDRLESITAELQHEFPDLGIEVKPAA